MIGNSVRLSASVLAAAVIVLASGPMLLPVEPLEAAGPNTVRLSQMGPDGAPDFGAFNPAVAYNPAADEYLVVWEGDDVLDEREIYGQRVDAADGSEIGSDFRLSDMGPEGNIDFDAHSPEVAYNPAANEYLVVWEGDDVIDGESEIYGQRIDATGAEVGTNDVPISDMGPAGNARSPAVTHNPVALEYLVVWEAVEVVNGENEIYSQRVDAAGAEVGPNDFRLSDMGPEGDSKFGAVNPAVASNVASGEYLVVWAGDDVVNGENEIYGQRVDAAGVEVGPNDVRLSDMGVETSAAFDAFSPAVAHNPVAGEYLVVWWGDDAVNGEFEIYGQRLRASNGTQIGVDIRISSMGLEGSVAFSAFDPAVANNPVDNQYLVAWEGDDVVDGEFEIFGQRYLPVLVSGVETVGLQDPLTGRWHLRNSVGAVTSFFYGNPGDIPFMGDWDCDGVDTPGLFRQSEAFAYLRNSNTQGIADIRFFFGNPGDIPLAGDWNGDGCDTLSLYRPSEQRFYIIETLGSSFAGLGTADFSFLFGNPGDKPVVGDWDGDGIDEVGLHRESTGFFYWRETLTTGIADREIFFGNPNDRFVAGDWGVVDGVDTPAAFRPSDATFYFRHTPTQGVADSQFVFGEPSFLPVAGEFGLG